jgi:acetylornithine deacetylase/succinyl-diaminopimelate desuccinylase-like protein
MKPAEDLKNALYEDLESHIQILQEAYQASIVSLEVFQQWVLEKFRSVGVDAGTFMVNGSELKDQPAFRRTYPDDSVVEKGPENVFAHLNPEAEDGVLFFAHADKSPISFEYAKKHPQLLDRDGRFSGPGIADDVAGIAAMISAVKLYKKLSCTPQRQILMASILGKQGGVFGSYGLMKRFGPLSSAVYLHPAESGGGLGELKIASNGLIEFSISIEGKSPDSTEVHQTIFSKSSVSAFE